MKNGIINFFKSNDEEHFQKAAISLTISLKQLTDLFLLKTSICAIEEIKDHYAIFIEIAENFLALTTAISDKKNLNINRYQTITNQQKIMLQNIFQLSNNLSNILKKTTTKIFNQEMSKQIIPDFKQVNNQIIRFLQLSQTVFDEN